MRAEATSPPLPPGRRRGLAARPWWPAARRVAGWLFLLLVLVLLVKLGQRIDWAAAWGSLKNLPVATLAVAAVLAAARHAQYCADDLIGRHHTGHGLPVRSVLAVGFISYAFNLNLGSLVGGVAFRYRLYSRRGLSTGVITQVLALSVFTNWLGYLGLAGLVLLLGAAPWPAAWPAWVTSAAPAIGVALLAAVAAYLLLCARGRGTGWRLRGQQLRLPSGRVAWLQLGVSAINWSLIAGTVFVLLQQRIEYPTVLAVLLLAAVAGVITHVPAGLGVLEAVFVLCLSSRLPQPELIGALLAYRAIYYLVPLALACTLLLAHRAAGIGAPPRGPA